MTKTYRPCEPHELKARQGEWSRDCLPYFVTEDDGTGQPVERFGWGSPAVVRALLEGFNLDGTPRR